MQGLPIPKDVLARARRVLRHSCVGDAVAVFVTEVLTDETLPPDMGFASEPFTSFVVIDVKQAAPQINAVAGARRSAVHTAYADVGHPVLDWAIDIDIAVDRQATLQLQRISVAADGLVTIENGGVLTALTTCETVIVFAAPADFLAGLLAQELP